MKVFLSSTFIDLAAYREAVTKAINTIGHDVVLWEQQEISPGESIMEAIEKSIERADLFVLIIGDRYGAIENGSTSSGVEHEYTLADSKNKPILVFIKKQEDKNFADGVLSEFSEKIMRKRMVKFFSSPAELESQIVHSISQYVSVVKSLQNPKFKWRSVDGVSKEANLDKDVVTKIIELLPNVVIRSRIPDKKGRALYATRKHYQESNSGISRLIDWFAV